MENRENGLAKSPLESDDILLHIFSFLEGRSAIRMSRYSCITLILVYLLFAISVCKAWQSALSGETCERLWAMWLISSEWKWTPRSHIHSHLSPSTPSNLTLKQHYNFLGQINHRWRRCECTIHPLQLDWAESKRISSSQLTTTESKNLLSLKNSCLVALSGGVIALVNYNGAIRLLARAQSSTFFSSTPPTTSQTRSLSLWSRQWHEFKLLLSSTWSPSLYCKIDDIAIFDEGRFIAVASLQGVMISHFTPRSTLYDDASNTTDESDKVVTYNVDSSVDSIAVKSVANGRVPECCKESEDEKQLETLSRSFQRDPLYPLHWKIPACTLYPMFSSPLSVGDYTDEASLSILSEQKNVEKTLLHSEKKEKHTAIDDERSEVETPLGDTRLFTQDGEERRKDRKENNNYTPFVSLPNSVGTSRIAISENGEMILGMSRHEGSHYQSRLWTLPQSGNILHSSGIESSSSSSSTSSASVYEWVSHREGTSCIAWLWLRQFATGGMEGDVRVWETEADGVRLIREFSSANQHQKFPCLFIASRPRGPYGTPKGDGLVEVVKHWRETERSIKNLKLSSSSFRGEERKGEEKKFESKRDDKREEDDRKDEKRPIEAKKNAFSNVMKSFGRATTSDTNPLLRTSPTPAVKGFTTRRCDAFPCTPGPPTLSLNGVGNQLNHSNHYSPLQSPLQVPSPTLSPLPPTPSPNKITGESSAFTLPESALVEDRISYASVSRFLNYHSPRDKREKREDERASSLVSFDDSVSERALQFEAESEVEEEESDHQESDDRIVRAWRRLSMLSDTGSGVSIESNRIVTPRTISPSLPRLLSSITPDLNATTDSNYFNASARRVSLPSPQDRNVRGRNEDRNFSPSVTISGEGNEEEILVFANSLRSFAQGQTNISSNMNNTDVFATGDATGIIRFRDVRSSANSVLSIHSSSMDLCAGNFGGMDSLHFIAGTRGGEVFIWDIRQPLSPLKSLNVANPVRALVADHLGCVVIREKDVPVYIDFSY